MLLTVNISHRFITSFSKLNSDLDTLIYTEWVIVDAPTIPPETTYFFTYAYEKDGYTAIGIIGYQIQSTNDCVLASRIYYSPSSKCICFGLRNTSGATQTPDYITACVLFVKN